MPGATRRRSAPAATARKNREAPASIEVPTVDIEIEDLAGHNESKNILVFGPSGQGKTALVGGTPRATFLSTESGVVSAKRTGSQAKLMRARSWAHCVAGIDKAEKVLGEGDWLIVDSVTKMQRLQIRGLLAHQHAMNGSRDLDIPGLQDHQKWQNQFLRFIDRIYDAPYNSIIVAQSMTREDQHGDDEVIPALIGGKSWVDISKYMCAQADVVLYYAISETASSDEETVRRALAQPYPPYFAKDRYAALGKYVDVGEDEYGVMADIIGMIEDALS